MIGAEFIANLRKGELDGTREESSTCCWSHGGFGGRLQCLFAGQDWVDISPRGVAELQMWLSVWLSQHQPREGVPCRQAVGSLPCNVQGCHLVVGFRGKPLVD